MVNMKYNTIALGLLAAIGMTGCFDLPNECEDDLSCRKKHGATFYCADDGICDEYTQSQYTASPCNYEVVGPVFEKGTFNVGVILALDKNAEYFGLIEPIARAIKLAQNDVNVGSGINGAKMGLIFCNTDGKDDKALAAARHLRDIGIQAVIGPDFSGYTVQAITDVFKPAGMIAVSPSATSDALSALPDDDLFWRTVAADSFQSKVLGDLIKYVSTDVVAKEKPKIAMLYRDNDSYATGLREGTLAALPPELTDSEVFIAEAYPNAGKGQGDDYSQVAIKVAQFNPDIVLVWGLAEIWDIIEATDKLMEQDNGRTDVIYITADGGKDAEKAKTIGGRRTSLTNRIWGTAPSSLDEDEYPPFKSFGVRWESVHNEKATRPFITNAYDATYLLAFAAAGAGPYATGTELAAVMKRLAEKGATKVTANQSDFPKGVGIVAEGGKIEFQGATGPLKFDKNGNPTSTTISLWCVRGDTIEDEGFLLSAGSETFTPKRCDAAPE